MTRTQSLTNTKNLRELNRGERERVRSLLAQREQALAESIKNERMALVLSRVILTLGASACVHDVARALSAVSGHVANSERVLAKLNIDEIVVDLEDHAEVVESYSKALELRDDTLELSDEAIDERLEELIVDATVPNERIERVAATLERMPPQRQRELIAVAL